MREYKFRAWDNENNKMVYDYNTNYAFGFEKDGLCLHKENTGENISLSLHEAGLECLDWESIDDAIFMQYTGIKDMNGEEIYEGDIVKFYSRTSHTTRLFVIKYLEEDTTFRGVGTMNVAGSQRIDSVLSLINADLSLKVVGDIFTTSELVKED